MTSQVHCFVGGLSEKKADIYYWLSFEVTIQAQQFADLFLLLQKKKKNRIQNLKKYLYFKIMFSEITKFDAKFKEKVI